MSEASDDAGKETLEAELKQAKDAVEKVQAENHQLIRKIYEEQDQEVHPVEVMQIPEQASENTYDFIETIEEDENLSLQEKEVEMIKRSLEKHKKRKLAAKELGISERTLYRKLKEYDINT